MTQIDQTKFIRSSTSEIIENLEDDSVEDPELTEEKKYDQEKEDELGNEQVNGI